MPGFRSFLAGDTRLPAVPDSDRTSVDGSPPQADPLTEERFRKRMAVLARRLHEEPAFSIPVAAGLEPFENPNIPAGYTYLLQFIAHDMVHSAASLADMGDPANSSGNYRYRPLVLDTLYGGGPLASPNAYEFVGIGHHRRRLRLGPMETPGSDGNVRLRDVPRGPVFGTEGTGRPKPPTEALITDVRNDDNGIISQLHAAFAHLHNAIVDRLDRTRFEEHADTQEEAELDRFVCARAIVCVLYRHIVRHDVLARLLHPVIYDLYFHKRVDPIDGPARAGDLRPTLEFAFAAMRVGHSMVRPKYSFSNAGKDVGGIALIDILQQTSDIGEPLKSPPNDKWIVNWSHFFSFPGYPQPDYSRRIAPSSTSSLSDAGIFPAPDKHDQAGLNYRDVVSAGLARVWRLQPLIDAIEERAPGRLYPSSLLSDAGVRQTAILEWLAKAKMEAAQADLQSLAEDPPLPFFLRFEAAYEGSGGGRTLHLGMLGSLIVAESFAAAFKGTQMDVEARQLDPSAAISAIAIEVIGSEALKALADLINRPPINTMADLLQATAELADEAVREPPFI